MKRKKNRTFGFFNEIIYLKKKKKEEEEKETKTEFLGSSVTPSNGVP